VLANQKQREVMPKTAVPDAIGVVSPVALPGLPAVALSDLMPAVQAAPAPRGTHILFVEDDDVIRMITTELLESLGHTVTAASSGEHALALLSSEDSILITDIGLLGMSGDVLAAKARARFPRLRVVLASGAPAHGMMDRVAVLQKPYDLDAIECALQEANALTGR
jgi:CheY-like chemotaxis protein